MKRAYVDTSVLVAIHFGERGAAKVATMLRARDELLTSAFTSAELLSTLAREGRPLAQADGLMKRFALFTPDGPLRAECEEALAVAPLRGADLWQVASALALAGRRGRKALAFCTLDAAQGAVTAKLGFPTIP